MTPIALEYHDIVAGDDFNVSGFPGEASASYKLAAADFVAHLRAVTSVGTVVVPQTAFSGSAPSRSIMLTFDDGGVSALATAAPLLEGARCRGIFLITSDYVGRSSFLAADQLRELDQRGHIIGSHSCSHPMRMAACTPEQLAREWRDSAAKLGDIVGHAIDTASVPGGYFSRAVAEAAADAGIRFLFTSEPTKRVSSVAGCRVIGRYTLRRWHPASVAARLVAPSSEARSAQWLRWNVLKLVKRLGGDGYLKLRDRMFGDA
ncbi:MAG: polysaccharide deacetylase family protein [Gemmatimonadaceae bacterium]